MLLMTHQTGLIDNSDSKMYPLECRLRDREAVRK